MAAISPTIGTEDFARYNSFQPLEYLKILVHRIHARETKFEEK